jgi:copper chaperone CopZ
MRRVAAISLLAGLLPVSSLADGVEYVKQTIYGMDCAPCAYGVEQGLKALSGVEAVTVSLNDGYAEVDLREDSQLTLADIREVIRKNGFSPKNAEVRVSGKVVESDEKRLLLKTDTEVFELKAEDQQLLSQLRFGDSAVTLSGSVATGEGQPLWIEAID